MLRACLIGAGAMGKNHGRVLHEIDGVDLVAVVDPAGDTFGIARGAAVYADLDEAIRAGIDMAVVAVPTKYHSAIGLQLAENGVHALIEKPVADSSEAGRELAQAFERAGLIGAVGHIERFNPAISQLRKRLENGDLGQMYQVATRRLSSYPSRISDVGVAMDLASHDVDLTAWVSQANYLRVSASTVSRSGRGHEDLIAIHAELEGGIVANHLVNWLSPIKERVTVVTGEGGAFVADTATGDLTFYKNGSAPTEWESVASFRGMSEGDVTRFAFPKREPLRSELEAFRDAVNGLDTGLCTLREGVATVEVIEQSLRSAREHAVRDLPGV
ncbi:MAG TPA: Gfo/Idh/MocA family oxidoreductase [Microbacteriaceae bacterium]|nr:Gfo/Idh/MocA family oxidoreductase [Microbacteriaceae bacterium]